MYAFITTFCFVIDLQFGLVGILFIYYQISLYHYQYIFLISRKCFKYPACSITAPGYHQRSTIESQMLHKAVVCNFKTYLQILSTSLSHPHITVQ